MSDLKLFVLIGLLALGVFGVYKWCAQTRVAYNPSPQRGIDLPRRNLPPHMLPRSGPSFSGRR